MQSAYPVYALAWSADSQVFEGLKGECSCLMKTKVGLNQD